MAALNPNVLLISHEMYMKEYEIGQEPLNGYDLQHLLEVDQLTIEFTTCSVVH
jgi:hypothetical protein